MASTTTHYKLTKPAVTDFYDVGVLNDNLDVIDAQIYAAASGSGLTNYYTKTQVDGLIDGHKKIVSSAVTVTSGAWSNGTATITVSGVSASNDIIITPAPASMEAYTGGKVRATAQAPNKLTLTADTAPATDIVVNVMVIG